MNTSILDEKIKDIDGNTYNIIKIGEQYWTVENLKTRSLNDGSPIALIDNCFEWGTAGNFETPAYNYLDFDADGAWYNWYAIGTKKLAPEGWRVPTDEDWTRLEKYLISSGHNWDGSTSGNKIAKSMAANTAWKGHESNGAIGNDLSKNNKSGFSARPGGYISSYCNSNYFDNYGYWWGSAYDDLSAHVYSLYYNADYLHHHICSKGYGFSVKLIKEEN